MCSDGYGEDAGLDGWLESAYDERYAIGYEDLYVDDAEEFERNQLALDNDLDDLYDEDMDEEDLYYDSDEYDDEAF